MTGLGLYFLGDHVEGDFTLRYQVLFLCGGGLEIKNMGLIYKVHHSSYKETAMECLRNRIGVPCNSARVVWCTLACVVECKRLPMPD